MCGPRGCCSSTGADVIVSDDGLQHLALARDFEIAVVDGDRGFGNGYLLPAGPLREPPERLASVDAVVINGEGMARRRGRERRGRSTFTMRLRASGLQLACDGAAAECRSRVSPAGGCMPSPVSAIRERFFAQLRAAGLEVHRAPVSRTTIAIRSAGA